MSEPQQPGGTVSASFRDPSGQVFAVDDRIIRVVYPGGRADLDAFLDTDAARALQAEGLVAETRPLEGSERTGILHRVDVHADDEDLLVLEHERVPFPSYPYEWPPEMLAEAGRLTLELSRRLLDEGIGLKDATPYNVLFHGTRPVFIDLLSFERRDPGDATWLPYAQFQRTFLLPLLANHYFRLPLSQIFTAHRDGLEPDDVYPLLGGVQRLRPPFLGLVTLPTWMGGREVRYDQLGGKKADGESAAARATRADPEKARFILGQVYKGLGKALRRVAPATGQSSTWSDYMTTKDYTDESFDVKRTFTENALREFSPSRVLDVGCNTGFFSAQAARAGASVVGIDYDPVVVDAVYRMARAEELDILPLAVDLTRPSPATGWRNRECPSFLDRARGAFDGVLMLAVLHHMIVSERVPVHEVLALAAEITSDLLIIEFVGPQDPMFRRIARGRDHLHADLDTSTFEAAAAPYFEIAKKERVADKHRWLYALRRRTA